MTEQVVRWVVTPDELDRIPVDKRAIGYIRVSEVGGRGEDLISPEIQMHSIETLAARDGLTVVAWIYDIDKSGRSFTKRRVNETAQGVRDGKWKYVILWKWSRWGRNLKESLIYLSHVEDEAGGIVRAATEDFDPRTSIGRFSRSQMLLIAELQSDMISDGWKEAQAVRRRVGLPHTGGPRFGYDYSKSTGYVINEERAQILRNAYERYVAGESMRSIALEWNALGLTTTQGNRWSLQSISRMMDTGFAAGLIRERTNPPSANASGGKNGRAIWAFDVWREGAHKPIIPRELWDAYKKRRQAQATMAPRLRTAAHALSGLMICGYEGCGGPMVSVYAGRSKKHSWTCYRARDRKEHPFNSISNARAEAAILDWLTAKAKGGDDVEERVRRMEAGREAAVDVERLDAEVRRLTAKRSRLANAYTDGDIERTDYLAQKAEIDAALREAQESREAALSRKGASEAYMDRQFTTLREEWDRLSPPVRRDALASVLSHIVVMPGPFGPKKIAPVEKWKKSDTIG